MKTYSELILLIFIQLVYFCYCDAQVGPDPWNIADEKLSKSVKNDDNVPYDLKIPTTPKKTSPNINSGEWFYRRLLSIVLKGGQLKTFEDERVEILLKMRLDPKQWQMLTELLQSPSALNDDMLRRSLGYIEDAIQPTISDQIVLAWNEYIKIYLAEYKVYIVWTSAISGATLLAVCLWNRLSHRHFAIIIIIALYLYEVFVSYKEAEKQELDRFLAAINSCSWAFWSSSCEVPKPDPIIFLKHMNPLKIGVRMFTNIVSEPIVTLSDTLKIMVHGMTDGLWYPLDKIVYAVLILLFNILLLFILIMVVFNFILNIPFKLSFFGLSLGVQQRRRSIFSSNNVNRTSLPDNTDRISGATLDRLLDVFSRALPPVQTNVRPIPIQSNHRNLGIRKSASTGRLDQLTQGNVPRRRNLANLQGLDASGDAH